MILKSSAVSFYLYFKFVSQGGRQTRLPLILLKKTNWRSKQMDENTVIVILSYQYLWVTDLNRRRILSKPLFLSRANIKSNSDAVTHYDINN